MAIGCVTMAWWAAVVAMVCLALRVEGWQPAGVAMLPVDVAHPSMVFSTAATVATSSFGPFASSDFGLPMVAMGSSASGSFVAQTMYALQETLRPTSFNISTLPDPLGNISQSGGGGGTSAVALNNGTVLYVSMCTIASPYDPMLPPDRSVIASFGGVNATELEVRWVADNDASNASCRVALLPCVATNGTTTMREFVVVVGGVWSASSIRGGDDGQAPISLYDPAINRFFANVASVPVHAEGTHTHEGEAIALAHPVLSVSSDGKLLVGGGLITTHNVTTGAWLNATANTMVAAYAISLHIAEDHPRSAPNASAVAYRLADLPPTLLPTNVWRAAGTATIQLFQDSVYYGILEMGSPGYVGRLSLSELSAQLHVSEQSWLVIALEGPPFNRLDASLIFLPLPHEGTVLALLSFGGRAPGGAQETPSVSWAVVESSFIPAWVVVPFNPTASVTPLISHEHGTINVSVTYELIAAGASGILALSPTGSCYPTLAPVVGYEGATVVVFELSCPLSTCDLWSAPLYLCFSDNDTVLWRPADGGATESTLLFTAINPFEPLAFPDAPAAPATPPPSSDTVLSFLKDHWLYFSMGGLGMVTVIAIAVSCRILRRKGGVKRGLSQIFNDRSALLDGSEEDGTPRDRRNGGRYDPLKVSTNSHSSRYITLAPLTSLDGTESDVTFLVQRKRDRTMLVMKYIPCEGDIERLLSIREFEALNILQGHPNVVQYVDMFMNYAFSLERLGRSHDTKHMMSDANDPTDGSLNTTLGYVPLPSGLATTSDGELPSSYTPQSSLLSPKMTPMQRPPRHSLPPPMEIDPLDPRMSHRESVANNRYVCLVMEYMPQGNIASWLMKLSEQQLPFTIRRTRRVPVEDLPPASEQLILSVALQVNALLKFMHFDSEVALAHKGLKPENVLVSGPVNSTGTFVPIAVTDFGFSVLGNFTPPSRLHSRRRTDSNELDRGSDCGSRSSMSQSMDTSGYLQSPKCDMWCFGCLLFSLCTFRFGMRFPFLAEVLSKRSDGSLYASIQAEMRGRGYSRDLTSLTISLLHLDEKLRPSSDAVSKMFSRLPDGTLSLSAPSVTKRRTQTSS